MDVGVALSGLLGLLGVVAGAVLTATMQARAARRTRTATQDDAAHRAVGELFAASDVLAGVYEGVWQLDRGRNTPRPDTAYARAVKAWVDSSGPAPWSNSRLRRACNHRLDHFTR